MKHWVSRRIVLDARTSADTSMMILSNAAFDKIKVFNDGVGRKAVVVVTSIVRVIRIRNCMVFMLIYLYYFIV